MRNKGVRIVFPSCIVSKIVIGRRQKPSYCVLQFSSSAAFFVAGKTEELQGEIKGCFLLGRESMTNLDSVLKSRDISLLIKICRVKAMVFPVVMYGCESWTIKRLSIEKLMLLNSGVGEDS